MFAHRLRNLRKSAKMSQQELARLLHVSAQAVGKWERDEATPNPEAIIKISEIFGVSSDYLLGREANKTTDKCTIPVLGAIPAGIPMEAIENIIDWEDIPAAMCSGNRKYFGLLVKGDSMYPDYLDGDTVIIRQQSYCDSGDICAVIINGNEATLKQVKLLPGGGIKLIPRNPEYPPRTYSPKEIETMPVTIAGVVVELRRKIKK